MKRYRYILSVLLLALVVRVIVAGFTCPMSSDGITYIGYARSLLRGDYVIPLFGYRCILYPLAIIAFMPFTPDIVLAGQAASVAMGVLTVLLVYLFGREFFDERVARIAALLAAIQPYMVRYSGDVLTEATYIVFFFLAAFLGLRALNSKRVEDFALCGVCTALAYFAKSEGLVVVVFIWLWIFLGMRKVGFGRRLLMAAASSVFVIMLLATQMYFYHLLTDRLTISEKFTGSVRLGQVESAEEMFYDPSGESAQEYTPPFFTASYYGRAVMTFFKLIVKMIEAGPVILALLLLGLLYRLAKGYSRVDAYIATLVLFYLAGFSLIRPSKRFIIPLLPFLLYWSAMGFNMVRDITTRKWRGALCAGIIGLMLFLSLRQAARAEYRWHWSPEETAGLWIQANSPPGPKIVSRKGWVAFYAEGERIPLPLTYEGVLECSGNDGADYLVFRESRLMRKRPEMLGRIAPADMELVHSVADGEDVILIYRFRKE